MPPRGSHQTPEARAKISAADMGITRHRWSEEEKGKISVALMGRPCPPETREKISSSNMGRIISTEHREKLRACRLGKHYPPHCTKLCQRCGKEYQPQGGGQRYCSECQPLVRKETMTRFVEQNPDKMAANLTRYRSNHLAECLERSAKWTVDHPERVAACAKKQKAKRRSLGFNELNSPFVGCEGHHINKSDVIYIPKAMHRSVRHNVWTGRNMEKINLLAGAYMTEDWT
jgi:hypothetical protein